MLRRLVALVVVALVTVACGGGEATAPATTAPLATSAPTETGTAAPETAAPATEGAAGAFTGVPGVPVAQPGEHPLPETFPEDFPVPSGGTMEVLDDTEDYISLRIDYDGDTDPTALLAFFEEGFVANGWEPTEQHSNKDQFGYDNENRQFEKDNLHATATVWFPQESGDPYVVMDLFRSS